MASQLALNSTPLAASSKSAVSPSTRATKVPLRQSHVAHASQTQKGRWRGMDADKDMSDDQQDISRGRGMVDELFQGWGGTAGTANAIMSSSDYISNAQRNLNNIEDGFYISPSFLDKLSIHVAKNFMNLPKIKVPLILGIWGGKGQGKTFQCMLAFKKLGISPIVMSAGELESGNAGEPAKLIRQRYREASDMIKKGKMCCLFINDLDAGAGRFGLTTQYTVNNQMVNATLMNIADNPTNVQLPGVYKNEEIPRVPIICTGNDFSTLYAPLIRDGRMEKYYWNPTREDRVGVCMGIFMEDNLNRGDVEQLVDAFPGQSIDFFGALRARVYDDKVREFVNQIGHENLNKRLVNSREGKVKFEKPSMGLDVLMKYGRALVEEQDNVKRVQLAEAYLAGAELAGTDGSSVPEEYTGAKNLKLNKEVPRGSWRSTPAPAEAPRTPAPPPTPSYTPPAPAASSGGDRWANVGRGSSGSSTPAPAAAAPAGALSAADLAKFKIADLVEIAGKKGVSGGRNATRDTLTSALMKAGVTAADLTKGQLAELRSGSSAYPSIPASSPAPAAAAAPAPSSSSSGDRWASYSRSSGSSGGSSSAGGSSDAKLSAGDLSAFKIVDLVELGGKKGVSGGRNATRDTLTSELVKAGVSLSDLTYGQLVDLGTKLGKAGLSRDITTARAELASLVGGSGSAAASWRATPTPVASSQTPPSSWRSTPSASPAAGSSSGDRWASYSRGSSAPAASSGSGSSGARLSAGDLSHLRIDDLRDLVKKTGAELPREPTKEGVISALVAKGVSLDDCTRGMLVDLSTKLGAPLARDVAGLKANLASRVGGGSSGGSSSSASSWRSAPPPAASPAPTAASGGDRWAKYSAGSTQAASWRRSGSHNASNSKLSASDLSALRIDDLRDLVKKTGAELPREPTKDGVISSLIGKGVSLNDLSRGMLVDLANKLGAPLARDVDSLRKNLASAVGKGSYSPAAPASNSSSNWRTSTPAASSSSGSTDRWASYSRGNSSSNGYSSASGGSDTVYEADLRGFKIDMLSEIARKKGISMRNATKDSLVSQLVKILTLNDLSRGQLAEILSNVGQSTSGSVDDLRKRVAAAASQRQSARGSSLAGSRW